MKQATTRGRKKDPKKLESIINTANGYFLTYGYHNTSLLEIAKASNVSRVTIYSYFPTKRHLFEECVKQKIKFFLPEVALPAGKGADFDVESTLRLISHQMLKVMRDWLVLAAHRMMIGLVPPLYTQDLDLSKVKSVHLPKVALSLDLQQQEQEELLAVRQAYFNEGMAYLLNMLRKYLEYAVKMGKLIIDDVDFAAQLYISMYNDIHFHGMLLGVMPKPTYEEDEVRIKRNIATFLRLFGSASANDKT